MSGKEYQAGSDVPFWSLIFVICGAYTALIVGMLAADTQYVTPTSFLKTLSEPEIQYSIWLSLGTCTVAAMCSLVVAIPSGFLLSRAEFPFKNTLDAILDIPIILPPLVVGLSLLILFQTPVVRPVDDWMSAHFHHQFTYDIPGVVLAQFIVACAFAVRTMRATFDHLSDRPERVALTLGCTRAQALFYVGLPSAWRGVIMAFTLAWARSMGEFGPILVFAGATRFKTEVLPTTVFLELSVGNLDAAVAVSLLMVAMAMLVLILIRSIGVNKQSFTFP